MVRRAASRAPPRQPALRPLTPLPSFIAIAMALVVLQAHPCTSLPSYLPAAQASLSSIATATAMRRYPRRLAAERQWVADAQQHAELDSMVRPNSPGPGTPLAILQAAPITAPAAAAAAVALEPAGAVGGVAFSAPLS